MTNLVQHLYFLQKATKTINITFLFCILKAEYNFIPSVADYSSPPSLTSNSPLPGSLTNISTCQDESDLKGQREIGSNVFSKYYLITMECMEMQHILLVFESLGGIFKLFYSSHISTLNTKSFIVPNHF